ncbi:thioesterase [Apibacter raozihei]|uniref:thioesterase n=1 Tax=Apibacter raozihei TaxID=2500547 RepID=UPI000FE3027D|nr:thioesterase [Apibacter raozihei]
MTKENFAIFIKDHLPIAELAGITLQFSSETVAKTQVSLAFINQNPFKSMFWAVQGMAAELSSGVLCINAINKFKHDISMLVIKQEAEFLKKAIGTLTFTCVQGKEIENIIAKSIISQKGESIIVKSEGIDESGDCVAIFYFTWSFKVRQ